jgi:hypothetical protein
LREIFSDPTLAMIEVKQATLADLVTVSSILKEAAGWLQATGRVMWRDEALILSALRASTPERRTPERRTPNAERPNAERQTPNAKRQTPIRLCAPPNT